MSHFFIVHQADHVTNESFTHKHTHTLPRQEMVRRYADAEATMGEARLVGETGPDVAGKNLSPTTVKVCD